MSPDDKDQLEDYIFNFCLHGFTLHGFVDVAPRPKPMVSQFLEQQNVHDIKLKDLEDTVGFRIRIREYILDQ